MKKINLREVSPKGETIWEFNCKTNGNTIFISRGQSVKGPQMIEVTKDKKIVWVLHDWKTVAMVLQCRYWVIRVFPKYRGNLNINW